MTVPPTSDPYRVAPLAIEDAFEFKAVYTALPKVPRTLGFYVYALGERGPVLVEQTKFQAPFPRNAPSVNGNFTGSRDLPAGYLCGSVDEDIHQVSNLQAGGADLVTLHVYSPPLLRMDVFSLDTPAVRQWDDPVNDPFVLGGGI